MPIRKSQPLAWFKTNPQVRRSLTEMQEMIGSLKRDGQLQDVAAQGDGTLIYGHRRLAAAAPAGLKELWVQVYEEPLTPAEARTIQLVENLQRVDLPPYDVAVAVRSLVEEGLELKEVAARVSKSQAWASRMMYPWKCIDEVQQSFKAGAIGITDCEAMAKAGPQDQHDMLAARLNGATRDDIARRSQRKKNAGVQSKRVRFGVPSGVLITLAGDGLTLDSGIDAMLEGVKEMRKGRADGLDAKTFQAAMACKRKGG